ncbi:hypothetical protein PR048_016949 [Dryococelus australis]|uniref:Uncharacterized protein n=1 Tax=Dryococelus australis TaxID=614101 RepID=A0ABQ9H849_9NEOP|nr:hypothetical protein PR048_016949 [Dryococelus australis]
MERRQKARVKEMRVRRENPPPNGKVHLASACENSTYFHNAVCYSPAFSAGSELESRIRHGCKFVFGGLVGPVIPVNMAMFSSWFPREERQQLGGIIFSCKLISQKLWLNFIQTISYPDAGVTLTTPNHLQSNTSIKIGDLREGPPGTALALQRLQSSRGSPSWKCVLKMATLRLIADVATPKQCLADHLEDTTVLVRVLSLMPSSPAPEVVGSGGHVMQEDPDLVYSRC